MSVDHIAALELRIARLEQQRRTFVIRLIALSAMASVVIAGVSTNAQSNVAAQLPFVLADGKENRLMVQSTVDSTILTLWARERFRLRLTASDTPSLELANNAANFSFKLDEQGVLTIMRDEEALLTLDDDGINIKSTMSVAPKDDVVMMKVDSQAVTVSDRLDVRAAKGAARTSVRPTSMQVIGGDGVSAAASLGLDDAGKGWLVVGTPSGARGVIGQPKSGGVSFALYNGPGTRYGIGMLSEPNNGTITVRGGKRELELGVPANGGNVTLYNDAGTAAVSIDMTTGGSGRIDVSDEAGNLTVQAGTTTDGLGVVRAGPIMGGPIGNTGLVPFAILGRRK